MSNFTESVIQQFRKGFALGRAHSFGNEIKSVLGLIAETLEGNNPSIAIIDLDDNEWVYIEFTTESGEFNIWELETFLGFADIRYLIGLLYPECKVTGKVKSFEETDLISRKSH